MPVIGDAEILVDLRINPASIASIPKQVQAVLARTGAGTDLSSKIFVPKNFKAGADQLVREAERASKVIQKVDFTPAVDVQKVRRGTQAVKTAGKDVAGIGDNIARVSDRIGASIQQFTGLSLRSVAILGGLGLAADPIVLLFRGIGTAISSSVKAARDLNEALSASKVVFGQAAPAVEAFARAATSIGQSTTQALDATRAFGSLLKSMGLTADQAAFFSIILDQNAADVASLANVQGGATDVAERFRSAIVGNFEAVERLNINIRASDVSNSLLRRGIVNTRSEIDTNTQSLETLRLILQKTGDAHGNFADTADEVANKERQVRAEITNLSGSIGTSFLPAWANFLRGLRNSIAGIEGVINGLDRMGIALRAAVTREKGSTFADFIGEQADRTEATLNRIAPKTAKLFTDLQGKSADASKLTKDKIREIRKTLDKAFKDVDLSPQGTQAIEDFFDKLKSGEIDVKASEAALLDLIDTVEKLNVAANRANQAIEQQADNIKTLINAQIAYDQSLIAAEQAVLNVEKAERARAATIRELERLDRQILAAELAVQQARLNETAAIRELNNAERDRVKLQIASRDAERGFQQAIFGREDLFRNQRRAVEDLTRAQEDFAEVQRELADDTRFIEASLNFEQAQLRLKEATLATNEALIKQADAQLALIDAEFDLERAQRRGRAGARDQARAILGIQKANLQLADAQLEPERARLGLLGATLSLREAELELQKVQSGVETRRQLQDADRALEDAHLDLRDATFAVAGADDQVLAAHIRLLESREAVLLFDEEIEKRRINVALATLGVKSAEDALFDARERRRDLQIELAERELAIRSALLEVKSAAAAVVFAYDALNVATAAMSGNTIPAEQRVEAMRKKFAELGQVLGEQVNPLLNEFNEGLANVPGSPTQLVLAPNANIKIDKGLALASAGNAVNGPQTTGGAGFFFPGLQHGGPALAGRSYFVGERGPELFTPSVSGTVIPSNVTQALLALVKQLGSFGTPMTANIIAPPMVDPRALAFHLARILGRKGNR